MKSEKEIWFPAKTYGWGWGIPTRWQGWAVLATYVVLVSIGAAALLSRENHIYYIVYMAAITSALILVCWMKGETPRWRWGGSEKH